MTYFELDDEADVPHRWWLKAPVDGDGRPVDPELFRYGKLLELHSALTISVRYDGKPLDWTFADFDMPVVSKRTATLLRNICRDDFQSFDATIEGYGGDFVVLNFLKVIRCMDEQKSDILFWRKEDGLPDKIGKYKQVANLRIDSSKVRDANIFRIAGWKIALIVSEKIKNEFQREKITGVRFVGV
jgi:hypothetical protein